MGAWSLTVTDRMTEIGRSAGLSATDQAALVTLLAHPDQPVAWLGDALGLTSSGATRLVDRLVASGRVGRTPGPDSRQRRLRLTRSGAAVAKKLTVARGSVLAESLADLAAGDRARLEKMLEQLVGASTPDLLPAMHTCRLCDRAACRQGDRACPLDHTVTASEVQV